MYCKEHKNTTVWNPVVALELSAAQVLLQYFEVCKWLSSNSVCVLFLFTTSAIFCAMHLDFIHVKKR